MAMRTWLATACLLATTAATAAPAPRAPDPGAATPPSAVQVHRLASVGKLWGRIRVIDPTLPGSAVDWDKALVEATARVRVASTPAHYRAAVQAMLATLGDPATRILSPPPAAAARPPDAGIAVHDGIVRVPLSALADAVMASGSSDVDGRIAPLADALKGARGVVIDARGSAGPMEDWATPVLLARVVQQYGSEPWRQGALRYRYYGGYPSQSGSDSSGGYRAAMMTELPVDLPGHAATPLPPMVVITDANAAVPADWLAGLQASGQGAWIAQDGAADFDASPVQVELADGLVAQVRTTQLVARDGRVGLHPDAAPVAAGVEAAVVRAFEALRTHRPATHGIVANRAPPPAPDLDRPYADMAFPSADYRLLALFRFWSVIDTFFPYRPLIGASWDDVLERYIPQFEANRNTVDYQMTLRRLVTEPHDSHVGGRSGMTESALALGRFLPPVLLGFVEGQTVVTRVVDAGVDLHPGDVIEQVDGRPVALLRDERAAVTPASTPQALQRDVHGNLLRGQEGAAVVLGVRAPDGARRTVTLHRTLSPADPRFRDRYDAHAVFEVLPSGLGYVDLGRLAPSEVDAMFAAIAKTPATVFDMRGYPRGTAWGIAPRLGTKRQPVGAVFGQPVVSGRDAGDPDMAGAVVEFRQRIPPPSGAPYLGKVVMLINEQTQSQAEHTGLFFEAMTEVTFIGSPTAGANGDVTEMVLPGGIAVAFSGQGVRHADGRQLQRIGLVPDVAVAPTIAGLARGQDEVLDAAVAWLQGKGRAAR